MNKAICRNFGREDWNIGLSGLRLGHADRLAEARSKNRSCPSDVQALQAFPVSLDAPTRGVILSQEVSHEGMRDFRIRHAARIEVPGICGLAAASQHDVQEAERFRLNPGKPSVINRNHPCTEAGYPQAI